MHRLAGPLKNRFMVQKRTQILSWSYSCCVSATNNSFLSLLGSNCPVSVGQSGSSSELGKEVELDVFKSVKMFQRSSERDINSRWGGFGSEGSLTHYWPLSHHMSHGVGTKGVGHYVTGERGWRHSETRPRPLVTSWDPLRLGELKLLGAVPFLLSASEDTDQESVSTSLRKVSRYKASRWTSQWWGGIFIMAVSRFRGWSWK